MCCADADELIYYCNNWVSQDFLSIILPANHANVLLQLESRKQNIKL